MNLSRGVLLAALATIGVARAAADAGRGAETIARASGGDTGAAAAIEERLSPLFERKDLDALPESAIAKEAARLLGLDGAAALPVLWRGVNPDSPGLLAIDFGASAARAGAAPSGYVAYAIVVRPGAASSTKGSAASVSWYHDTGRKLAEQGGEPWHPVGVTILGVERPGGKRGLAVAESGRPAGTASGALVFESDGDGRWSASRRLCAPAGLRAARLVAIGDGGAVFVALREPPKGVLMGAPPEQFRSLVLYERTGGAFADDPVVTALPDAVSAAEAILAALRRGDKPGATALCRTPDVLESLLYFSPTWKGGGRIVSATPARVEFKYEEQGRPPLRIEMGFANAGGMLLLASATGRAEGGP